MPWLELAEIVLGSVLGLTGAGGPVAAPSAGDRPLEQALERTLADGWGELHILTQCQVEGVLLSAEIFGSGVGIWRGEAQFRLPPERISEQLAALSKSGFANWPESFGGKRDPKPAQNQPPRVTCRVSLDLDGHHKQVVQFQYGDQSPKLAAVARGILDACRAPGRSGVRAESLNDGLGKIANGELDPVTLQVIVNRRSPLSPREDPGEAWLLRIDRGEVTTRDHTRGQGYGEEVALALDEESLAELMGVLRKADLAGLPPNLYAELYTDVSVSVLDQRAQVQARRFDGMTPETHGEKQKSFDRLLDVLEGLRERVLASRSEGES
jgi:hypothetical protein